MARGSGGSQDSSGGQGSSGGDGDGYPGGAPAPASVTYEAINLFGRGTGHRVSVQQGDILPVLPRGFGWVLAQPDAAPEA